MNEENVKGMRRLHERYLVHGQRSNFLSLLRTQPCLFLQRRTWECTLILCAVLQPILTYFFLTEKSAFTPFPLPICSYFPLFCLCARPIKHHLLVYLPPSPGQTPFRHAYAFLWPAIWIQVSPQHGNVLVSTAPTPGWVQNAQGMCTGCSAVAHGHNKSSRRLTFSKQRLTFSSCGNAPRSRAWITSMVAQ